MESLNHLEKYVHDLQSAILSGESELEPNRMICHLNQLVRSVRLETRAQEVITKELREQLAEEHAKDWNLGNIIFFD